MCTIELCKLDLEDRSFAIRSFTHSDRLAESLDRYGLLFPVWVREKGDRSYAVVDGFKRWEWAVKKGVDRLDCVLFPRKVEYSRLLLQRIEAKIFGPALNVAEKAQIVSKLTEILPHDQILARFFPMLGLAPKPGAIEEWSALAMTSESLLEAAATGEIHDRAALELPGWETEAREESLFLLREIRCSASIQVEILDRVTEIAAREERQRIDVLRRPELKAIVDRDSWNHRQKTQALRDLLARWRFPRLRAREEQFARDLSAASLPKNVHLIPPPAFEGTRWRLQLSFSRPEELPMLLERARSLVSSSKLHTLMSAASSADKK